ncbi:glycosyltransferase family 2 protein [Paenibacillus ihbetae]|nr:glycosyltransferase family 2 protein [Paenibacillus ihbetae]
MTLPISLCMIIRDEEHSLEAAIKSLQHIITEIIVVDTGSNDRSIQLAESLGAYVIQFKWCDNFSAARNRAIEAATKPYIFMMDADERFDKGGFENLKNYINSGTGLSGKVMIKNYTDTDEYSTSQANRIFPNNHDYRYEGRIHEQLQYKGRTPQSVNTGITLLHFGYMDVNIQEKNKIDRNLKLLFKMKHEDGDRLYISYQIGKTYYVGHQYEMAFEYLSKVTDYVEKTNKVMVPYASDAWLALCYCLYHMRNFNLLTKYIESGIEFFSDYTDLYFIYGLALTSMNHPDALAMIPAVFNHCLALGESDPTKYETSRGVGSFKAHYNLGVYWEVIGDLGKAINHYEQSAKEGFLNAINRLEALNN